MPRGRRQFYDPFIEAPSAMAPGQSSAPVEPRELQGLVVYEAGVYLLAEDVVRILVEMADESAQGGDEAGSNALRAAAASFQTGTNEALPETDVGAPPDQL